jgi:hypothetical protein
MSGNFNRLLQKNFAHKGEQELYIFIDSLMDEVAQHEIEINQINNKKSFPPLNKNKIKGLNLCIEDEINSVISAIKNNFKFLTYDKNQFVEKKRKRKKN